MKRIPLHDEHIRLNGKMVPFAGFEMPVQYSTGIIKEHMNVRQKAGLFDISHMGEVLVEGKDATTFLQMIMVNDLNLLYDGKAQYSTICTENGGTIEDTFYYRHSENKYRLIINASNRQKDIDWLNSHISNLDVKITDLSDKRGRFALQGPSSEVILDPYIDEEIYFTESNTRKVKEVIDNMRIIEEGFRCNCTGQVEFKFYNDDTFAGRTRLLHSCMISAPILSEIQQERWILTPESREYLCRWLAENGVVFPLAELKGVTEDEAIKILKESD